ncbi:MAG: NADH-quinone oxidoreductase subunit C [Dehalococcoidia bacterium]|nr:NADH-quinone oxidoreductase subunit C [Dehalococcoidia bacterium]
MKLKALDGNEMAARITGQVPDAVIESNEAIIVIASGKMVEVMRFLKESPDFDFNYLNGVTAVDNADHFEIVYHLTSLTMKHTLCVKARISDRENPEIFSITPLWRGAELQEREIFDLMGIRFAGHPNLKRIVLWDGFEGYPLRKDFGKPKA